MLKCFTVACIGLSIGNVRARPKFFHPSPNIRNRPGDRLATDAGKENFTKAEIAAEAGFGTYKSYMRAREHRNGQAK